MARTTAALIGLILILFVCRCSSYYAGRGSLLPLDFLARSSFPYDRVSPLRDPYGFKAYQQEYPTRGRVGGISRYMTGTGQTQQQYPIYRRQPQYIARRVYVNPGLMRPRKPQYINRGFRKTYVRQPIVTRSLIQGTGIRRPQFVSQGLTVPQQPRYINRRLPTQFVKQPVTTRRLIRVQPKQVIQKPSIIRKKIVRRVNTGNRNTGGQTLLLPGDYSMMIGGGIGGTPRLLVKDGQDTTIQGVHGQIQIESGNQISFESGSFF